MSLISVIEPMDDKGAKEERTGMRGGFDEHSVGVNLER